MSELTERRGERQSGSDAEKRYFYRVYGLVIDSEVELPELVPVVEQPAEVTIRFGSVVDARPAARKDWYFYSAERRELMFVVRGIAAYRITDGSCITIERRLGFDTSAPPPDIRLWLLGSAFAALLHQRGLLPLHVSALNTPAGVWAFTGDSGEGKSTLAAFLHRRFGWDLVSDDVSVIDQTGSEPLIQPGPRKLKLWADALSHLGFDGERAVRDLSTTDKFQLYLSTEGDYQPAALRALVILESAADGAPAAMTRLSGLEAFQVCLASIYRPSMEHHFKLPQQRLADLARLCKSIAVYRFSRPRSLDDYERNLAPLLDLMFDAGREPCN